MWTFDNVFLVSGCDKPKFIIKKLPWSAWSLGLFIQISGNYLVLWPYCWYFNIFFFRSVICFQSICLGHLKRESFFNGQFENSLKNIHLLRCFGAFHHFLLFVYFVIFCQLTIRKTSMLKLPGNMLKSSLKLLNLAWKDLPNSTKKKSTFWCWETWS